MNVIKAYRYLFYRTYLWQLNKYGKSNNPKFLGIFANSACIFLNLLTLMAFFQIITNYKLQFEFIQATILMTSIISINYFYFLYKNRLQKVIDEFTPENASQRKHRTVWCLVYVIFTHVAFLISIYVLSPGSK